MKTPHHSRADGIRIAQVAGSLQNLSGKLNRAELTMDQAVAQLHAITTDPHLLAHGLGNPDEYEPGSRPLQIAAAAGINVEQARAIYLEMHPPGTRGRQLGADGR